MIKRLRTLDSLADMQKVMTMDFDEANRQPAAPARGQDPLFYCTIQLSDHVEIPEEEVASVEVDDFKLPPHGTSEAKDFDLLCHLELEPEKEEEEEEEEAEPEKKAVVEKKYQVRKDIF